jgi:hypothetical protein
LVGIALLAALGIAGCGGQSRLSNKALSQVAKTLQSLAYEGDILADDAAQGRSTSVFTAVHARFLWEAARSSSSMLKQAETVEAKRLAQLGVGVTDDLERLSRSGSDRGQQRRLQRALAQAGATISKLGKRL